MKAFMSKNWWWMAGLAVLGVWLWTLVHYNPLPKGTVSFPEYWTWRGTFGDMFGAANSLFSAFVVIGVAYGIVQQRQELRAAKAAAAEQRFLSLFFPLLEKIDSHRTKMKYAGKTGRDAIVMITNNLSDKEANQHAAMYLMNIYNILDLIDHLPQSEKDTYKNILTGCLSLPEYNLLWTFTQSKKSKLSTLFLKYYNTETMPIVTD